MNFTAWWPGYPNGGTAANCMYFSYGYQEDYRTWGDYDCDDVETMRPMCKAPFKLA